jgi:hypothetical protein
MEKAIAANRTREFKETSGFKSVQIAIGFGLFVIIADCLADKWTPTLRNDNEASKAYRETGTHYPSSKPA